MQYYTPIESQYYLARILVSQSAELRRENRPSNPMEAVLLCGVTVSHLLTCT